MKKLKVKANLDYLLSKLKKRNGNEISEVFVRGKAVKVSEAIRIIHNLKEKGITRLPFS